MLWWLVIILSGPSAITDQHPVWSTDWGPCWRNTESLCTCLAMTTICRYVSECTLNHKKYHVYIDSSRKCISVCCYLSVCLFDSYLFFFISHLSHCVWEEHVQDCPSLYRRWHSLVGATKTVLVDSSKLVCIIFWHQDWHVPTLHNHRFYTFPKIRNHPDSYWVKWYFVSTDITGQYN